ncbi:hypothetical protein SAMN02745166_03477 [Prosthecobacter debontii]|uniref:HNH endonuclease n=1 Tax=Prosthecobacter debontii TaxID=48467 RepID=A0A1T4YJB5_9BACT|nr:hypothetical protein [Prosthecobacter debontii]SKB01836.1 hypothetical protein SAMN02745166_03477 [Prosthecobacter debontii]
MKSLPIPTDETGNQYAAGDVFDLCISSISDADLVQRLEAIRPDIVNAANLYNIAGNAANLYATPRSDQVGNVTGKELKSIYSERLSKIKHPARRIYDKILAAPKLGRCPLCDNGSVGTLDHYLPKSAHTVLSVTPNNLVPSCWPCQMEKRADTAATQDQQTLHPYFDSFFESETWLCARVIQTTPPTFEYYINPPAHWPPLYGQRLEAHMEAFNLKFHYGNNAANELSGIRHELKKLYDGHGASAVTAHLLEAAISWEKAFTNSWTGAMYRGASQSQWFCNGNFYLI